jgi:hypothetical protein
MNIIKKLIKIVCRCVYCVFALVLKIKKTNITDVLADDSLKELHNFSADLGSSCFDSKIIGGGE